MSAPSIKPLSEYPDILTIELLAQYLCKAVGTLYNWRSKGVSMPAETLIGGTPHFRRKDVEKWLDASRVDVSRTGRKAVLS